MSAESHHCSSDTKGFTLDTYGSIFILHSIRGSTLKLINGLCSPSLAVKTIFSSASSSSGHFVLFSEPHIREQHKRTHTPFFVRWQMWPLAVMVNPECWV